MRTHLCYWLRTLSGREASRTRVAAESVSLQVPEVVSGVSNGGAEARRVGSLAAIGLSLCVASCAEPMLDGVPEDPGQHMPLPTIVSPAGSGLGVEADASVEPPSNDVGGSQDASLGTGVSDELSGSKEADAGIDGDFTDPVTATSAQTATSSPSSTSSAAGSVPTDTAPTRDMTSTAASSNTSGDTASDDTDATNANTDTSEVEDAGAVLVPGDGGFIFDAGTSDDTNSAEGDAGDGGLDGGVEL
jgi:hypothetical protein